MIKSDQVLEFKMSKFLSEGVLLELLRACEFEARIVCGVGLLLIICLLEVRVIVVGMC